MFELLKHNKIYLAIGVNGVLLLASMIFAGFLLLEVYSVFNGQTPTIATAVGALESVWTYSRLLMAMLVASVMIFLGAVIPIVVKREDESANISTLAKNFEKQAVTDPLTELPNRRYFEQAFEAYLKEFNKLGKTFGLLVLDLDHFKSVNDTHGHDVGDLVLREVALRLNAITREHDIVARLGGEEFAVITPYTSVDMLMAIAERYRSSIESLSVDLGKVVLRPTVSIGVATNEGDTSDIHVMFKQADHKLYEAKRNGRNRVAA